MRRILSLLTLALSVPAIAMAQGGNTTVTAIVKDPNGALYVGSQVNITFIDPGTPGKIPLLNGSTFQKQFSIYATDSFGSFTISLPDTGIIDTSSGTSTFWSFRVIYNDRATSFVYQTHVDCAHNIPATCTAGTMDISTQLQAVAAVLPTQTGGGISWYTVAFLPPTPILNTTAGVIDGNGYSCTSGGGSTKVLCHWNGASWDVINQGSQSAPSFSSVTSGTNSNILTVGTGGSLSPGGSGTITATTMPYPGLTGFPTPCGANQVATQIGSNPGCITLTASFLPATVVYTNANATFGAFTYDFSGSTLVKMRSSSNLVTTVNGDFGFDTNNLNVHIWNGADSLIAPLAAGFVSGHCGQPTSSSGKWTIVDAGATCGGGTGTVTTTGSPSANQAAIFSGPASITGVSGIITGAVYTATNAAAPGFVVPGIPGADVSAASYTIRCDSATSILDRGNTLKFTSSSPQVITVPDPTTSGCGNNFMVVIIASGSGGLTINRTTTATFDIYNGSTSLTSQTSFPLIQGQYTVMNSPDNVKYVVRVVTGGTPPSNPCTDNPVAGVLPTMNTTGHVYCLNGAYTFSTAQTISNSNITIILSGPGTTITRSGGTTDGLDISGTNFLITGCGIFDGGSLNGGPLMSFTGNQDTIGCLTVRNFGTSNPAVSETVGDRLTIEKLTCSLSLYRCVELVSSGGAITNYTIRNSYFSTVNSASAPTLLVHVQKSGSNQIGPGEFSHNTVIGRDGVGNSTPVFFDGPSAAGGVESPRIIGNHFGSQATLHAPVKLFGVDHCVVADNTFRDDGNITANGQIYLGDFYHCSVTGNDVNQTAATPANCINMTDGEGNTFSANVCHNFNNGGFGDTAGIHLNTAAGNCSHNIITGNTVYFQSGTAGDGIEVFSSTNGFACSDNLITNNKVIGTNTAGQTGVHLTLSGTGTATDNKVSNNHIFNTPTGIQVDAGVTPTEVSDNYFHTVTTPFTFAAATLLRQFQGITFAQAPLVANLSNGSIWFETDANATCAAGASTGKFCIKENGAIAAGF